jgi:GT2 family glycosyltransferase
MKKEEVSVALCIPVYDKYDPASVDSYRLLRRDALKNWHYFSVKGLPVDQARNELTRAALDESDATHLLWIDDDMVYPPDALYRMLDHDVPFVGGLCFDRRHPYKPVIARYFDPSWGFDPHTFGWLFDYPNDALIEVDATGGAFLLVKREVFEAIRTHEVEEQMRALPGNERTEETRDRLRNEYRGWWKPLPWQGASEDLSFCWRAQREGFKLHVDTGLKIGHVGEVIVDEAFAKRNRQFEYAKWHPPLDALLDAIRTRPRPRANEAMLQMDEGVPRTPIATIIVTTYNEKPEYLRGAVQSALMQTVPVEVVVVDDGSETPAAAVLSDLARAFDGREWPSILRVLRQENQGISGALNTGIAAASCEWIGWLPSDDQYEPNKIEVQLAAMLNANAYASYTGFNLKIDNGNSVAHVPTPIFRTMSEQNEVLSKVCAINGTTILVHRSVFDRVGPFDLDLRYAQDWAMWRKIGFHYVWMGLPDKLATRREFGNLTERLRKVKDPRKMEEDEIVKAMKPPEVTP